MDFTDINKNLPNGENMGGLMQNIYFGLYEDVSSWPTEPDSPADLEENGVLTGDLVMKAGKRMFAFYATDDTANMEINDVGEVDGMSQEVIINAFHPGLQKKILGFLNATKNENLVLVVEDCEGQRYLIGSEKIACKRIAGDGSGTGAARADRKGANLKFRWPTNNVYVYDGNLPITVASS
jgi:hypothetical protein